MTECHLTLLGSGLPVEYYGNAFKSNLIFKISQTYINVTHTDKP